MKISITEIDTGTRNGFEFEATCDGKRCGRITAARRDRSHVGAVVYSVDRVDVFEPFRRHGVATKLYEAAAREACTRRARLASLERNPDAHSTAFWKKQVAKGRAIEKPIRGADADRYTRYVLKSCDGDIDLSGLRSRR